MANKKPKTKADYIAENKKLKAENKKLMENNKKLKAGMLAVLYLVKKSMED